MGVGRILDEWTAKKISLKGDLTRETDLTREAIDEYTMTRLRETVAYAREKSSFYRELYEASNIMSRGDPTTPEEFTKLPFTDQEDLRKRGMELLCVKPGEISRIVTLDTGGSTGSPKRVYFTEEDQQLTVDFFENGMQLMAGSCDNVLILMPARVPGSIGRLLAEGLRRFGAQATEYGLPGILPEIHGAEKNLKEAENILKLIKSERITGVVALPTHMAMLADMMIRKRKSGDSRTQDEMPEAGALKWALLSAEYVGREQADKIAEAFGCRIYEHYGMTEMGLGCAVSCGCGEGYHVREADLYIEIIDPQTGRQVNDGGRGEIVFTTLTRTGMPFIRYRTGDFSRWITGRCACGSILKRLGRVEPRGVVKGYLKGE